MKPRSLIASLLVLTFAGAAPTLVSAGGPGFTRAPRTTITVAPLDAQEASTLQWMREEEKMARDVYLNLYQQWKEPAFQRIATSEQRHFDAIGAKLALYGLSDPALPVPGQFTNPNLQTMHDQLMASGQLSYVNALTVGATIEDLDIFDLQNAIAATDEAALKLTYQHLLDGSKNHMRAFASLLLTQGVTYTPQYIDQVSYDAIIGQ